MPAQAVVLTWRQPALPGLLTPTPPGIVPGCVPSPTSSSKSLLLGRTKGPGLLIPVLGVGVGGTALDLGPCGQVHLAWGLHPRGCWKRPGWSRGQEGGR